MKRQSSQFTEELNLRIQTNQKFGDRDLTRWLLEKLNLRKGERLLDIGCGTGKLLIPFARITKDPNTCMGIDVSAESIDKATRAAVHEELKINLVAEDMDDITLDTYQGKFDIITSIYAAYYSNDIKALLTKLSRTVTKAGRICIMGPYMDNNLKWFEFLELFMKLPPTALYQSSKFMCDKVLPFALENYDVVQCYRFVNHVSIPSTEDLFAYWKSNTYYEEKYDSIFLERAKEYFIKNNFFKFAKTALLVIMQSVSDRRQ